MRAYSRHSFLVVAIVTSAACSNEVGVSSENVRNVGSTIEVGQVSTSPIPLSAQLTAESKWVHASFSRSSGFETALSSVWTPDFEIYLAEAKLSERDEIIVDIHDRDQALSPMRWTAKAPDPFLDAFSDASGGIRITADYLPEGTYDVYIGTRRLEQGEAAPAELSGALTKAPSPYFSHANATNTPGQARGTLSARYYGQGQMTLNLAGYEATTCISSSPSFSIDVRDAHTKDATLILRDQSDHSTWKCEPTYQLDLQLRYISQLTDDGDSGIARVELYNETGVLQGNAVVQPLAPNGSDWLQ